QEDELIEKGSGARFSYKGQQIGHGEANTVQYLRDNPAVRDEIAAAIMEKRKPKVLDTAALEAEAAKQEEEAAAELAALGAEVEMPKKKRGKASE
ncbi:MAG TPA: recombinase RecA, partial [Gemmata sp.]|nr:recombinase RecA [Gemmata sp.]